MIEFHNYSFQNKDKENVINNFVKDLVKKTEILYFDEFQVTNIVDAMILGRLFKRIFEEKIKVIFTSNIFVHDLYKDGLQRDQFIPFIKVLEKNCDQKELLINEDYRSSKNVDIKRFLFPINNSTNFTFNKFLRKITKNKKQTSKILKINGRKLSLENFYDRIIKFKFDELCNRNLGSADYIEIAKNSDFIFITNLPEFNENNSDQQQRFITLIDIVYEKKIPLMITSDVDLDVMKSNKSMSEPFKRTISRLYELTSMSYEQIMKQEFLNFKINTDGQKLYEFTNATIDWIKKNKFKNGLLNLNIQHTSASLIVQENADPDVKTDLINYFDKLVPMDNSLYIHTTEGKDDMPAHIKSSLTNNQITLSIKNGELLLGTWQGLYLFEHRLEPQSREVIFHFLGN